MIEVYGKPVVEEQPGFFDLGFALLDHRERVVVQRKGEKTKVAVPYNSVAYVSPDWHDDEKGARKRTALHQEGK